MFNALLQATERFRGCSIAAPPVGRILCCDSFRRGAAERAFSRFRKASKWFEGHRVGALSELRPDPAPTFLMLIVELLVLVAGLGMWKGKDGLEFLAKLVLLLLV